MSKRGLLLVLSFALLGLGCPEPESPRPSFRPVVPVQMLMTAVVDPAADGVWDSVGTIMTMEETQEIYPRSDEEWNAVLNSAVILAESGNLLMMEGRARDREAWIETSQALVDAGAAAMQAAAAKDAEAIFDLGEQIYNACEACHSRYWIGDMQRGRVGP